MKTLLCTSLLLAFSFCASAQYTAILGTDYPANSLTNLNQKPNMRTGTVAPTAACTAGLDLYVNTSTAKLYFCSTLNVWTEATAGGGGSVSSVYGRTGAVIATSGDYTAAQVTNAVSSIAGTTYTAGAKQTFVPSGSIAGLNFGTAASAPSSGATGDVYFDTTLLSSRVYVSSAWRSHLIAPTSGTGFMKWDGSSTTAAAILNAELPAVFDISSNTSTAPIKAGTTLPGTCSTPQLFFDTDATAGQNLYACTSANTWTLQAGGGGGTSTIVEVSKTADYTVVSGDANTALVFACASTCTATFPGTPLSNGVWAEVRNIGPSVVNVASSALIDGSASTALQVGDTMRVMSNGTLYRSFGGQVVVAGTNVTVTQSGRSFTINSTAASGGVEMFTASGTFTPATGITRVYAEVWSGGGGGSGVNFDAGQGGGGGGFASGWVTVTPGVGVTVTVGSGGAGGIGNNFGATGGTSSFGSSLSATGGAGGDHGGTIRGAGGKNTNFPLGFNINSSPGLVAGSATVDSGDVIREDQGGGGRYNGTASSNGPAGRAALRGGGGGGASGRNATFLGGAGGASGYGGAGGTGGGGQGGAPCTAGTAPGGGGGAPTENTGSTGTGCAGARGEVRVYY